MNSKELILQFVKEKGITDVFAISGGYNINILDAFYYSDIKTWFFHHQQSLVFAAEGYYRMTGKIPLCLVTAGPGVMNTINGIYGCWVDSIPLFIISGNCPMQQINHISDKKCRQLGQQDSNIVELVKSITKYSILVVNPSSLRGNLEQAWVMMQEPRRGPVLIDIPLDIQNVNLDHNYAHYNPLPVPSITKNDYNEIVNSLNGSKKPVIIVGNGVRLDNSVELLNKFVKLHNIPVLTGCNSGADCVDNTYKYYAGRIGINGQPTSNKIVNEADLIIVMGSRLNFKMTGYNYSQFAKNAKKIIIDVDNNEIMKHSFQNTPVLSSVGSVLSRLLLENGIDIDIEQWLSYILKTRKEQVYCYPKHLNTSYYLSYYYFLTKLSNYTKQIPIVLANGTANVTTLQMYKLNKNQRMFTNIGSASMGWGLPASIGASIAHKDEIICIQGDGSIMMNLQQLQTIKQHNLPIKIFVINNQGYNSIKISQNNFCLGRLFGSNPDSMVSFPKFELIANAFQIPYFSIKNNNEVQQKLAVIIKEKGCCLVQMFVNPLETHEPKVVSQGIDDQGNIIPGTLVNMFIKEI